MPANTSALPAPSPQTPPENSVPTKPTDSPVDRRKDLWVLAFFLCLLLLFGSGRLGSTDAKDQLQSAQVLVNTSQMGTPVPPGGIVQQKNLEGQMVPVAKYFWWQAPNGLYYQTHDIGDMVLMIPVAWLVSVTSPPQPSVVDLETPVVAKVLVSLMWSCIGAGTSFFLYKTFALLYSEKAAFGLALLFTLGTFFWPYTKTVWDVTPTAFWTTLLLYQCTRMLLKNNVTLAEAIAAVVTVAVAASFRFGTLPFLGLALILVFLWLKLYQRPIHVVACAVTFVVAMLPTFIYNQIRMGAFWRPATLIWRYKISGTADFSGDFLSGAYGLTFSLNKGIFICAPILLLTFLLPWVWKRLSLVEQRLVGAFGFISFAYLLLFSKIPSWSGNLGWGPRYMVNFLPLFFFVAAVVFMALWSRYRVPLLILAAVSIVANFPPLVVNWDMALTGYPRANDQTTNRPYPQMALWSGLGRGLRGEPLPPPIGALEDVAVISANSRFPDLWYARLISAGGKAQIVGYLIPLLLMGTMAFALKNSKLRSSQNAL